MNNVHVVYSPKVCVRSKLFYTCWYSPIHALVLAHFRGVILYNDSPVATGFLCLLDTRAEGSEVGVDGREGVSMAYTEGGPGQGRWREQGDAPPVERLLRVEPAQVSRRDKQTGHIFECMNILCQLYLHVYICKVIELTFMLAASDPSHHTFACIYMYIVHV